MNFLAVFMMLSAPAFAGKRCPEKLEDRTWPCTASKDEQDDVMKYVREGMTAYDEYEKQKVLEEALRKDLMDLSRQGVQAPLAKQEDWAKANKAMVKQEAAMQSNFDKAAKLTSQYYGLGHQAGGIVNGPLSDYSTVAWKPEFLYTPKDKDGRYLPVPLKIDFDPEDKRPPHYMGVDFGKEEDGVQGQTIENGKVYINIEAFKLALNKGSPRLLAKTLYHEGLHYEALKTTGWKKYREEMEPSAYEQTLAAAGIFELRPIERMAVENQMKIATANLAAVKDGTLRPNFSFTTPEDRKAWRVDYKKAVDDLEAQGSERRTLEEGLEAARDALARERQKQEDEQKKQEETFQKTMDEYNAEVRSYGFVPLRPSRSGQSPGFADPYRAEYRFTAATSLLEAKMALFFSWACAHEGVRDDKESENAFANLLIDINNNWREPIFRSRLELETTDGSQEDCLRYVRDNLQPPMSLQKVDKVVSRFWKDWSRGALHRYDEYERQRRLGEEARDRQNRGQSGPDRRDDGSGNGCTGPNKYGIIGCPAPNQR